VWDPAHFGKEAAIMWFIWHKVITVNEWKIHIAPTSISKKRFASLIQASRLNISLGTEFKSKELGDGPLSSCMNFAGFAPISMLFFIENKPSLGKGFLRSLPRK